MANDYEKKAASAGLSGAPKKKEKKGKKKVRSMRVKPAANGGYVAEHEMEHEPGEMGGENPTHVIPEGGMDAHMAQHMPSPAGGAPEEEAGGEGGGEGGAAPAAGAAE
jgi:hypothetical protein